MSLEPTLIAPFRTGLETDAEPWLAPPDSFTVADNVHIHHGYLQKRSGYRLFSYLSSGKRVMGLVRHLDSTGDKKLLAFDTVGVYIFNEVSHAFDKLDLPDTIFSSGDSDYICGANWQSSNIVNRLYFTNGLAWNGGAGAAARNGIRYYQADAPTVTTLFTPTTGGGNTLYGGKLLFTLGQRLIVLSTFENVGGLTTAHSQRARWCSKQNPANWDDLVAGGGDFADAATGDQIVSAQTLQNQIIVFFTNSVWALLPTPDPNKAFRWIRLNNYRACDGKMASVAYDRYVVALGIRGITATDGTETQRIDNRIQDFTINNINIEEFGKVFCFRSYETLRWWTLYSGVESEENNRALIYDDDSKAFTTYTIALNCMGYGHSDYDYGLDDFTVLNSLDYSLDVMGDDTLLSWYWDKGQDILLGGDLYGSIYRLELGSHDFLSGQQSADPDIEVQLVSASWNPYQAEGREAQMPYIDFYVDTDKKTNGTVDFYVNDQLTPYVSQDITFFPNLNFVTSIAAISKANPCNVNAPNHGLTTGITVYIYQVSGMDVINSGNGYVITVVDSNNFTLDGIDSSAFEAYTGGGGVYLREFYQTKTWIRAYGGGTGYLHKIRIRLTGGERPFRFHAFKPYFKRRGKRTIN